MSVLGILDQEDYLVHTAAMYDTSNILCSLDESHFGDELVDHDHEANGADEASEEWAAQDIV